MVISKRVNFDNFNFFSAIILTAIIFFIYSMSKHTHLSAGITRQVEDQLYQSIHMFDCFFILNFSVDLLYPYVCLFIKNFNGIRSKVYRYTVFLNKDFVLSKYKMFCLRSC